MESPQFNVEYGMHTMNSFKFESGRVLENVDVSYVTYGTPKCDEEGNINNVIIFFPTVKGGFSVIPEYNNLVKKYGFNIEDYFYVRIFSLGTPESCSPSTTGLKDNFPEYTIKDRINFKKQFLAEKFNIHKVLCAVGEGTGGFEIFTWACEYPDDIKCMVVINSSYKTYGYRYVFTKCIDGIIDSMENYFSEDYSTDLSKLFISIFRLAFAGYFPDKVFQNLSREEIDVLMEDYVDESLFMDIYDFKYRNDSILDYDLEDKLGNIKAKALIIGLHGYLYVYPNDIFPLKDLIKDCEVKMLDSKKENYYEDPDNSELFSEILSFFENLKNKKSNS